MVMTTDKNLSTAAKKLLGELVEDLKGAYIAEERTFDINYRSTYIYNLLVNPKYRFSVNTYKEIFEHLCNYVDPEKEIQQLEFKNITGWNTVEEQKAYDTGREHEERVTAEFIEKWDGNTRSQMGQQLYDKLKQLKDNIT